MTLRWRVALWSLALCATGQFAFLGLASTLLHARLHHDMRERAGSRADQICALLQQEDREEFFDGKYRPAAPVKSQRATLDGADEVLLSPGALAAFGFDGALIRIRDLNGARVGRAELRPARLPAAVPGGATNETEDARDLVIARRQVRLLLSRYPQPLTVIVGWPLGPARSTLLRVEQMLMALSVLTLLIAGLTTFAMAGRALSPLAEMSRQADDYSVGELSRRLPGAEHSDEVGRMAVAFNRLLARLEDAFQREKRFTSDAAHELRTPLTILRGEVDLALREHPDSPAPIRATLRSLKEEIEHLEGLVANLLTLARSQSTPVGIEAEPVSLLELSSEVIARLSPLARMNGVGFEIAPDSADQTVLGDPTTLRQAVFNVVQNGVRYSPHGGTVRVRIAGLEHGAVVEVLDAGPGIPESALPHLFDRFFRADASRTRLGGTGVGSRPLRGHLPTAVARCRSRQSAAGAPPTVDPQLEAGHGQGLGLGLAITRAVVQAHGGEVRAENLPGRGAKFTIRLPAYGE